MSAAQLFSLPGAFAGHLVVWTLVALFGLIVAIGRKRLDRRVRWTAIAAFVCLLVPSVRFLAIVGLEHLAEQGVAWANPVRERLGSMPFVVQLYQPVGFLLLTVAIFVGRKPIRLRDPDAG